MPMFHATGSRAQGKTPEIDKITPDVIFQAGGHVKHEVLKYDCVVDSASI